MEGGQRRGGERERERERKREREREREAKIVWELVILPPPRVVCAHTLSLARTVRISYRIHTPYTLICSLSPTIYLPPPLKPPFNPPSRCPPPPPPLARYKIHNCDVLFREDCDDVQLIDVIEGNRKYIKVVYVYNKIDQICLEDVDRLARKPNSVVIGVHMGLNLE